MDKKILVGIIFGGRSAEHEISLLSVQNIVASINTDKYDVFLIGIDKEGVWYACDKSNYLLNAHDPKTISLNTEKGRRMVLVPGGNGVILFTDTREALVHIDVAFPIIHGPHGEDGTLQGLLRMVGIPFVGTGVLSSAVGMDKDVAKRLLRDAGIPIGKFKAATERTIPTFRECVEAMGVPLFVKPANLGSSIGVNKVRDEQGFIQAVREAFLYDTKILIEEYIKGREIVCSVLGGDELIASIPGEIIPAHEFYSYEAKYIDDLGAQIIIPAQVSPGTSEKIKTLAVQTCITLSCYGFARVDLFLTESGEVYVNEINTIPGFTSHSMYPKLWEASGVSRTELIDRLIELALVRFDKKKQLRQER